jgi:hypothetical protein
MVFSNARHDSVPQKHSYGRVYVPRMNSGHYQTPRLRTAEIPLFKQVVSSWWLRSHRLARDQRVRCSKPGFESIQM